MTTLTQENSLQDILKWEQDNYYSRDNVTVLSGESVVMGEVVGKITKSTPTTGTAGTNTGNGTMTAVTAGADAQIGTYTATCTAAATNGGTFKVVAPDGAALPDATVGTAFANDQLNFTINDGATDFAVGDSFTVAVAAGSGKVVPIDFTAVDGSQNAYGFMTADVDASSADTAGVVVARDAIIVTTDLTWPTGATAGQKTAALAQLAEAGIISRSEI